MSSNTPNLGLLKKDPMVDGNETFNIETMLNENWDKVDEAVGQVRVDLGNIDVEIPDASLIQKGIVQLSSATNGARENVAATEKAVKAAYDRGSAGVTAAATALPRVIPDTRSIATKPSDYNQNVAYSFKTGPVVGLTNEEYVVIHGFKGWNDDSGGITHEYASGGTTGGMYHRTGTTSNNVWSPWMQIIDNAAPWQKRRLTEDNGQSIAISNGNANSLTSAGYYVGENIANAPRTAPGEWYYINVIAMAAGVWVKQIAINLFSNTYQMRTGSDAGGGVISWGPWTEDLFTSVANGKNDIAAAIRDKGQNAQGSDSFLQLANAIRQIRTDIKMTTGSVYMTGGSIANLPFKPTLVFVGGYARYIDSFYGELSIRGWSGGAYLNQNSEVSYFGSAQGSYSGRDVSMSVSAHVYNVVFKNNSIDIDISVSGTSDFSMVSCHVFGV